MDKRALESLKDVGIKGNEKERAGSYFLSNRSVLMSRINRSFKDKLEVMDIKDALKKHSWLRDYYWKIVDKDQDEYTKAAYEKEDGGYFIRVFEGEKVDLPLQSCMLVSADEFSQKVHNVIIAERGSEANIISGCLAHPGVGKAEHIGISEFYIKDNAKLNFTMTHRWNESTVVRPRSSALIGDSGKFVSNYICLNPVKSLQMYPKALCNGKGSAAVLNSLVFGDGGSCFDIGSRVLLNGHGSRGEVVSRTIAKGKSTVIARGMLEGNAKSKAHLECSGLLLSRNAKIHAVPELFANTPEADLSHEAAVGKIAEKEIIYLMSRGVSKEEAASIITRGFMDVTIFGLPEKLRRSVQDVMDKAIKGF